MVKKIDIASNQIREHFSGWIKTGELKLLSTISGYQEEGNIFIVYHCVNNEGAVDVRTSVPLAQPVLPSIVPVLPAATLYEREVQDLLGVRFEGHPDPRRLVLPEDFPDNVYPLRKDYVVNKEK